MIMMSIMPTAPWPTQLWALLQWEAEVLCLLQRQGTLHASIVLLIVLFSCVRERAVMSRQLQCLR